MRSTAGKIFGAIGGVMEAAIRSAYFSLTGKELKELKVQEMRGLDGIKEAKIKIGDLEVGVAVASSWSYRAAMLADVLAGESPAGVALPGSTVVISAVRKGDQPGESADVKVLVGWCAGAPVRRSDPPGGRANGQAVAKVEDHKRTRRPRKSVPARSGWRGSRARRALDSWAKAIVVGEEYIWERAAGENSGGVEGGMFGKSGQRKHGTTRGSPRRSRTAKALRITGTAGKSRRACEWGGWGRLSDDGAGQNNPYRSEGPWGRAACAARMAASNRAGFLDSDRGFRCGHGGRERRKQTRARTGYAGSRLNLHGQGEGPDGKASLGAVLGKTRRTES
jgi:hypothetical protein